MELRVSIEDSRSDRREEAFFRHSPVRIGRNALNDLVFDQPSVSAWHAQLSFDEGGVWLIDVGSTNGSTVDGVAVATSEAAWIEEHNVICIGHTQVRVSLADATDSKRPRRNPLATSAPEALRTAMTHFDVAPSRDDGGTRLESGEQATAHASNALAQLHYLRAATEVLKPLRDAYLATVDDQLEAVPKEARKDILSQLVREFPDLVRAPELVRIAADHGIESNVVVEKSARERIEEMLGAQLLGSVGEEVSDARLLSRVALLLQTFCDGLFELSRSRAQLASELGVPAGETPASSRELLQVLFDFRHDGSDAAARLTRLFADLATQQLALVSATRDGVRAVLDELAPQALQSRRANGRSGTLAELWPDNPLSSWRKFKQLYEELREGDRFVRVLFGARFRRSYLAIAGRGVERSRPMPQTTTAPEQPAIPATRIRP